MARRTAELQRPVALPTHAVLLVATLTAAVTRQGGYFGDGQRLLGALLLVTVALACTVARPVAPDLRFAPVVACAALAGWAVVSAALAGDPGGARATVLLLAGMAGVLLVCRRTDRRQRDALAGAVVAAGALCAVSGWAGVAWRVSPLALEDQGLWRAATSLTYANAAAALLGALALLALARLVRHPAAVPAAVATCLLLIGAGATLSRAGLGALVAGAVVLAALLGPARVARAAAGPVVGALAALAALAPSMPAGSPARPALAAAGLVVGLAIAVAAPRLPVRAAVVTGVAGVVALAAVASGPALGRIARPRLTLSSPDRAQETAAALRRVADRPLTGAGPGRLVLAWAGPDGTTFVARWAHDEYLQVLGELGIIGLAFVAAVLVALGRCVARNRASSPSREVWAGVVAGLVALALHSAFDFLWRVPAIPLLAALLVGLTVPSLVEEAA